MKMIRFLLITFIILIAGVGCQKQEGKVTEEAPSPAAEEVAVVNTDAVAKVEAPKKEVETGECDTPGSKVPSNILAGESKAYGDPFTVEGDALPLAEAIRDIDLHKEKVIDVAATIDKVCSMKGCWMTLKAPEVDKIVRVRMKGHAFFVPRNAHGGAAVAHGVLSKRHIPKELLQHYAKETPGTQEMPQEDGVEYVFVAQGVKITMPKT